MMKNPYNNHGFSLVELIVGMAIAAIVSGMVLVIVQFSSNSFRSTTAEESAQQQAQTVTSQINDYVMNTKGAVCYYVEDQMVSNDQNYEDVTPGSANDLDAVVKKQIMLYDQVGTEIIEKRIEWNKTNQKLFVDENTADAKPAIMLAQNVDDFSVDLKDAFTHKKIYLHIRIRNDQKMYGVDQKTINLRNQLLINQIPESDSAGDFTKVITGTKVTATSNRILPGTSVSVHGTVQANYSVSQACRYYILVDDHTKVSQIPGYCSIDENTGEIHAESYLRENRSIVVIAYPVVVMNSDYTESEQRALAGTMTLSIVSNAITSTQIIGPTTVNAGETIQYSASVSGYPGVSQECRFTMFYNGSEVTSVDNGNVTMNTNGELICGTALTEDMTVEIMAMPLEIYESDLAEAEKLSLSGRLNIQLLKKAAVVPQLYFVTQKSTLYTGQRYTFSIAELHGFSLSNITWSIPSGSSYATVDASSGQVRALPGTANGSKFTVRATANYGTVPLSIETTVTVMKPNFILMNGSNELTEVFADFAGKKLNSQERSYSLVIQLDGVSITNSYSSTTGTLKTSYFDFFGDEYLFRGLRQTSGGSSVTTFTVSKPSISFYTYDPGKYAISNSGDCFMNISISITLQDGTTGAITKSIPYRYYIR